MKKLMVVNKPVGLTPLQIVKEIKRMKPELASVPMSYAGRLDPLAHGVLLIMVGEETKHREKYLSLTKEYICELVLGLQTDTYDLLGCLERPVGKPIPKNVKVFVNSFVKKNIGKYLQSYPPYSSKPVNGQPLFWWAKNKRLNEIEIPKKEVEIFELSCTEIGEIDLKNLKKKIKNSIAAVDGDFRQKEIMNRWEQYFEQNQQGTLTKLSLKISCSSGTYVRGLVNKLGDELGCGAVAIDILRIRVGTYNLKDAISL